MAFACANDRGDAASIEASILDPSETRWTPCLLLLAALRSAEAQKTDVSLAGAGFLATGEYQWFSLDLFYRSMLTFELNSHPWPRSETVLDTLSLPHQWGLVLKICSDIFQRDCRRAWACVATPTNATAYAATLARVVLPLLPAAVVRDHIMPHLFALPPPPPDPRACVVLARGVLTRQHINWTPPWNLSIPYTFETDHTFEITVHMVAHFWRATRAVSSPVPIRSILQYVMQHAVYARNMVAHLFPNKRLLRASEWVTSPHLIVREFYDATAQSYAGSNVYFQHKPAPFNDEFLTQWVTMRPLIPMCYCWSPAREETIISRNHKRREWICEKKGNSVDCNFTQGERAEEYRISGD